MSCMMSSNDDVLIVGLKNIAQAVGRSERTVQRWYKRHSFPMCHLPNGNVATTRSLIDMLVLARNRAERGISVEDIS